jgi:uncharacterized protein (TIGR02246 family)
MKMIPYVLAGVVLLGTAPGGWAAEDETARVAAGKEIARLGAAYERAFEAGDAKALAACFTPDGELVDETGRREAGRAAIAARAGAFFRARPGATLRSEEDSFRFVGAEAAEQEGTVVVLDREGAVISRSRYGILYVRHEGEWLMASVRDLAMPGAASRRASGSERSPGSRARGSTRPAGRCWRSPGARTGRGSSSR